MPGSRAQRGQMSRVGRGALVRQLDLPVAVEAPNLQLSARLGVPEFLRRARQAASLLLDNPHRPQESRR